MALFGITASQWRNQSPTSKGNIRDDASLEQLVVLSNLESLNVVFLNQGLRQNERLLQLNNIAIVQLKSLVANKSFKKLK